MPAPYVSSMFYIPNALLSSTERARLRQELTIVVDRSQTDPTALGNEPDEIEVKSYDLSVDGYFGVPRQYGFANFPHLRPEDRTVSGNNVRGAYKGLKPIKPRNDQQADYFRAIANICNSPGIEDFVAVAKTGCHAKGTRILLHSGGIKSVEDIVVGDTLMGPDGSPRKVLRLCRGKDMMYRVTPNRGEPFVVNEGHVLSLVRTRDFHGDYNPTNRSYNKSGHVTNITVKDYLSKSGRFKHLHKLRRSEGLTFDRQRLDIDPYFMGVLLGDGSVNGKVAVTTMDPEIRQEVGRQAKSWGLDVRIDWHIGNKAQTLYLSKKSGSRGNPLIDALRAYGLFGCESKFIPFPYKVSDTHDRLELLAGLIDTDGYHHGGSFEITQKSTKLADGICYVARSLGFHVNRREKVVNGSTYHRMTISGHADRIPVRLSRKKASPRKINKNPLYSGFRVEPLDVDNFYGFTLDGDHLYLTEDFVVHHNSGKTAAQINAAIVTRSPILILVHTNRLKEQWLGSVRMKNGLRYFLGEEFVDNYVGIIQQDTCDFENKAIGIGLIHSVARREYPKEFYNHWRVVAMDELHKHTAPNFAGAIMKFPQRIRGGMTATLREDALSKIAHWHYGPVRVTSEQKVLVPKVYFCRWNKEINARRINQFSKATTLTSLTELPERNELLAKLIYKRGYKRKRNVLVISDRVHQLQDLRKRVIALGANPQKLGLYTGRVYTGKWNCGVTIKRGNSTPDRHKLTLPDDRPFPDKPTARRAANEFIKKHTKKISRLNDKLVKRGKKPIYVDYETKIEEDYYTLEDAWYRLLEKRCSVFFTTYGIFEAGNDIARLDMGVEASPRADQRQPLGRILRDYDGKGQPEWYSMVDHLLLKRHPNEEAELLGDFVVQAVSRRRYLQRGDIQIANVSDLERMFSR